jgi:hypothetical protein
MNVDRKRGKEKSKSRWINRIDNDVKTALVSK